MIQIARRYIVNSNCWIIDFYLIWIDVKVGDTLKVGDRMLVLEAMKMENNIVCEKAGTITAIKITVGQQVLQDAVMIEIE